MYHSEPTTTELPCGAEQHLVALPLQQHGQRAQQVRLDGRPSALGQRAQPLQRILARRWRRWVPRARQQSLQQAPRLRTCNRVSTCMAREMQMLAVMVVPLSLRQTFSLFHSDGQCCLAAPADQQQALPAPPRRR